jgi:hypothetical protein
VKEPLSFFIQSALNFDVSNDFQSASGGVFEEGPSITAMCGSRFCQIFGRKS